MTIEQQDDMEHGALSIEEMLESGDPVLEEYAQQLQSQNAESGDQETETETSTESAESTDATQSGEQESGDGDTEDDATDQPSSEQEKQSEDVRYDGVHTKDNKHILPYSELESARNNYRAAKDELSQKDQELAETRAEMERMQQRIALAEKSGVEMPKLPEEIEVTDDMIEELSDLSPELGVLAQKIKLLEGQRRTEAHNVQQAKHDVEQVHANAQAQTRNTSAQEPAFTEAEVHSAIDRNPALKAIMMDPKLSNLASMLEQDIPLDAYASLDDRYVEVVKRVSGAKGVDFAAKYSQPAPAPSDKLPAAPLSISDLPANSADSQKSTRDVLAEQSPDQLHESVENMSMQELESILGG